MSRFFWEGASAKRKYHLVRWEDLCRPKDQGGLRITSTKTINIAVMVKWVWKIFTEKDPKALWLKLIRVKYPDVLNLFSSKAAMGPQFRHNIHKIKDFF